MTRPPILTQLTARQWVTLVAAYLLVFGVMALFCWDATRTTT